MSNIGKTFRIRKDLKLHEVLGECKVIEEIFALRGEMGTIVAGHSKGKYYTSLSKNWIVSEGMIEVGIPMKISAKIEGYIDTTVIVPEGESFNFNRDYSSFDNEPHFDQLLKGMTEFDIMVVKELRQMK
jgi:hypothetical protein